jgi:hypothetical protein
LDPDPKPWRYHFTEFSQQFFETSDFDEDVPNRAISKDDISFILRMTAFTMLALEAPCGVFMYEFHAHGDVHCCIQVANTYNLVNPMT